MSGNEVLKEEGVNKEKAQQHKQSVEYIRQELITQRRNDSLNFPDGPGAIDLSPISRSAGLVPAVADNSFFGSGNMVQAAPSGANILKSTLRYKWTIFMVFVLLAAPAITFVWTQIIPEYQARGEVRVQPIIPRLVFNTEDNGRIPLYESFVNTQVALMRSPTVLRRVLDQEDVKNTQWYKNPPQSLPYRLLDKPATPAMERLKDSLSVRPRRRTEMIDVSFSAQEANDAKIIVNAVLDQYLAYTSDITDESKDAIYSRLTEQYKSLDNENSGREKIISDLRKALGTGMPEELIASKRLRLDKAESLHNGVKHDISLLEWQKKEIGELLKKQKAENEKLTAELIAKQAAQSEDESVVDPVVEAPKQPKYHADAEWRRLDIQLRTIKHRVESGAKYGTTKKTEMAQLEEEVEFTEELLKLREGQLDEDWQNTPKNIIASKSGIAGGTVGQEVAEEASTDYEARLREIEYKLGQANYEEKLLQVKHKNEKAEFDSVFNTAQMLEKETGTLAHKRQLFNAVRERLDQKNMERNVPGSIKVFAQAMTPSRPAKDRRMVFTIMAIVMAIGVGGGVGFLRASRCQDIQTLEDMPDSLQNPFLGYLPIVRMGKASLIDDDPVMLECARMVRTSLLAKLGSRTGNTVLITSASAGTGKSSVTSLLGRSLARVGKKVLIVDADLRRTGLSRIFDLADKPGLVDYLKNGLMGTPDVFPTDIPGLMVMPAGQNINGFEFDKASNGAFSLCIEQLRQQYDIILLDGTPVLPVADARILSGLVDGTVVVERQRLSQREDVVDAITCLGSSGCSLLGTIFIGSHANSSYGYGYSY